MSLSAPVDDETLQPIPGRDSQIIEVSRRVDQLELPHGRPRIAFQQTQ
nr:hypothetical protein [Pseudoglutamicibacter cumminsii]